MFEKLENPPVCECGWRHQIPLTPNNTQGIKLYFAGMLGFAAWLLYLDVKNHWPYALGITIFLGLVGLIAASAQALMGPTQANVCPKCDRTTRYRHAPGLRCPCGYKPEWVQPKHNIIDGIEGIGR